MQKDPNTPQSENSASAGLPVPPGSVAGMETGASPAMRPFPEGGYPPWAPPEEDEINLLDLFIVLLKHKWMIFSVVFLTGIAAVVISLLMPNIYRSEAVIAPTAQEKGSGALSALGGFGAMIASEVGIGATGSLEQFDVVLKSREMTTSIVNQHNLLPVLFEDNWDPGKKTWKDKPPKAEDIYNAVHGLLKVTPDKKQNVMKVSFESKDPALAQKILNYFVVGLSEFLRRQTLEDAAAQQEHLSQQLARTTDPLLKNKLYDLIARQIEKETLARVQKYFSFNVVDPAFVPERKFKPKRAQICILSVVIAFFVAIFLAFFLEYVHNLKTREDPERLANLRASLRLRQRS